MLVSLKKILQDANKRKYAVGAFNVNNLEILKAITNAAEKLKSPVILQTSEGALEYAGLDYLYSVLSIAAEKTKVPVVIHLDHGKNIETIKDCIKKGYSSVMIDASKFPIEKNIGITKKVVSIAHKKGVSVEAEIGTIGGAEDLVSARKIIYTEPKDAKRFVDKTGIDALAVAIGTSHGAYKFSGAGKLDIKRLREIDKIVKIPLVLHGASGVPGDIVSIAKKYGAKFEKAEGVPDSQIKLAVRNGIRKINTDTDLRLAFTAAVRKVLAEKRNEFDPRNILGPAKELMQKVVEKRMKLFGSAGKAIHHFS